MMSGNFRKKSPHGEGLSISQVWCDVFNFLVGILCITNGFRVTKYSIYGEHHPNKEMVIFTGKMNRRGKIMGLQVLFLGFAYCAVNVISLVGFCLGKKFGFGKIHFWSRVWMFPVLTALFIMAMVYNSPNYRPSVSSAQFFLAIMGYIWFLLALSVLLCRRFFSCYCGKKTRMYDVENSANVQARPDSSVAVENIYENDFSLPSCNLIHSTIM